jgi:hypothetical protein
MAKEQDLEFYRQVEKVKEERKAGALYILI